MDINHEVLEMRADISALTSTVVSIAEDIRTLKADGLMVKLDLAKHQGVVTGALLVITLVLGAITWIWDRVLAG